MSTLDDMEGTTSQSEEDFRVSGIREEKCLRHLRSGSNFFQSAARSNAGHCSTYDLDSREGNYISISDTLFLLDTVDT